MYNDAGFLTREVTATGVTREYSYDAAGQLVRLVDSEAGVSEFVYDGLGRRVQHRRADGSVRDFAFSPVGLLAQVSDDGAPVVRLWNDALSQSAGVVGADGSAPCELVWDLAAGVPTVLGAGGVPVSLAAGVGVDVLGARGVDPFAASPVVSEFGSGVAGGVTVAGSVQVAGLEVLGARAYDPVSRGFMSPDPVVSPVGAGWGANVYSFVGNAPSVLVDPWGLSPMTAAQFKEYREDVSGRALERLGKGLADFARDNAGWIALGVAAVGVAALAVSGPVGWGILTGMLISGGVELGSQWLSGEPIDWKKVALSASIGGIAGGFGAGAAGLVTKLGSSAFGSGVRAMAGRLPGAVSRAAGWVQKAGSYSARGFAGAYVEAGVDTSLTYVTDGHHVTAGGLAQAWGVPAFSNALVPKPVSKYVDNKLSKFGWDAAEGVAAKGRSVVSDAAGNFVNGVASYSGAPMTHSAQFESYQGKDYKGPGWHGLDAFNAGLKEMAKGGASSSRPVESLKSVSFDVKSGGGFDYGGAVRDLGLLGSGASGVQASVGVMVENVREDSGE